MVLLKYEKALVAYSYWNITTLYNATIRVSKSELTLALSSLFCLIDSLIGIRKSVFINKT